MKRLTQALLLAACLCAAARAQTGPRPIDSFPSINASDWLARLDNLAIELQNDPSSRGYIVAHPEKYTLLNWPPRRAHWARGYLIENRGIDPDRVGVAVGEFRARTEFDLWVVLRGQPLPFKQLDYALALAGERAPVRADVLKFYPRALEIGNYDFDDGASPYETLAALMRADPSLRLCVVGYAARRDRRRGSDRRLAASKKREIMTAHALPPSRVVALGAGRHRRDVPTIELWLVPPGADLPAPAAEGRATSPR